VVRRPASLGSKALVSEDQLLTSVEGPKGSADIFEIVLPTTGTIEVEYKVVFEGTQASFPSMGEAHVHANKLVGLD
jgi:hypothetical protein